MRSAAAAVVAALFVSFGKVRNLYDPAELLNLKSQIQRVSFKWVAVLLFLAAAAFAMKAGADFSRGSTIMFAGFGITALIGERVLWRVVLADGLAVRRFHGRRVVLIAERDAVKGSGILKSLDRHGLEPTHQFILPSDPKDIQEQRRVIAKAISAVRGSKIEEITVGADPAHWSQLKDVFTELRVLPIR